MIGRGGGSAGRVSHLPRCSNSTVRPANPLSLSPIPPPQPKQRLAQVPKLKARLGAARLSCITSKLRDIRAALSWRSRDGNEFERTDKPTDRRFVDGHHPALLDH